MRREERATTTTTTNNETKAEAETKAKITRQWTDQNEGFLFFFMGHVCFCEGKQYRYHTHTSTHTYTHASTHASAQARTHTRTHASTHADGLSTHHAKWSWRIIIVPAL